MQPKFRQAGNISNDLKEIYQAVGSVSTRQLSRGAGQEGGGRSTREYLPGSVPTYITPSYKKAIDSRGISKTINRFLMKHFNQSRKLKSRYGARNRF
jgi:hypothetical protein